MSKNTENGIEFNLIPLAQVHRRACFDGGRESAFRWCLHCERTYPNNAVRIVKQRGGSVLQMCPYPDCDGDTVLDSWDWPQIRKQSEDYPARPVRGVVYPMYPKK